MKIAAINGSLSKVSYNRKLLQFIQKEFSHVFDIDILELDDVPNFKQFEDQTDHVAIQNIYRKVHNADGVIIATGEHSHTVLPAVKNIIEHLSVDLRPFQNKPVLVVGASYYNQGTSRAQLHLKQILEAPGVNAYAMPGNEFLLSDAREAFDDKGNLKDEGTVHYLREVLGKFKSFVEMITEMEGRAKPIYPPEDLEATNPIETTITGVDYTDDKWVDHAAEKVHAVDGDTYVKLNHGVLTVNQINHLLESMPMEITYADENNQFIYYNYTKEKSDMLAGRDPEQVGLSLKDCHPSHTYQNVEKVIQALRYGETDRVEIPIPIHGPDKHVVHFYQAMHDHDGNYRGVNEYIFDVKRVVDLYLKQTNQQLISKHSTEAIIDATAGASDNAEADHQSDATAGASDDTNDEQATSSGRVDTVSSASSHDEPETDSTSGASE